MKLEIQSQDHINIHALYAGYVVIEQITGTNENSSVFIAAHNIDMLCHMLQEAKTVAQEKQKQYLQKKNDCLIYQEKNK